jgi:hypothetical protein
MPRKKNTARDPQRFSRRRFIRTAGVGITLPMLPSLLHTPNASAQACGPARRFLAYHFPNGHKMDEHLPEGVGSGSAWSLPPMLAALEDLKSELCFISGLENQQRRRELGDHAIGCGALLTARKPTANQQLTNTSVDQVIADALAGCSGIHSLQLGTHNAGPADQFGNYYTRSISWRAGTVDNGDGTLSFPAGPATPLGKEVDAQKAFDRLFAGSDPTQSEVEAEQRRALRKSVLDTVLSEQPGLATRLNMEDRRKVDELFTGIRALETELQGGTVVCDPPEAPGEGLDYVQQLAAMHELMAIAFQCDVTRVISFMMSDALSNRNLGFIPDVAMLGGETGDHSVSHHSGDTQLVAKFRAMVLWKMDQVAAFLRRLATLQDADGQPLLHNTLVWISSEISDGNRHNHDDHPIVLAGRLGGLVVPDRHVRFPTSRDYEQVKTFGDFFITLMSLFGVTTSSFGDDGKEAIVWQQ